MCPQTFRSDMALSLSREKETTDERITFLSCSFELSIENAEMYKEEEKETKNKKRSCKNGFA